MDRGGGGPPTCVVCLCVCVCVAAAQAHTPPASPIEECTPPAEVCTTPAETMKLRAMPKCTTRRDGGIGPHAHGSVGRQVVDDQDSTWGAGAIGPHARGNAARHAADDLHVQEIRQQKP